MDTLSRIQQGLTSAVTQGGGAEAPPLLTAAIHHAVFAGGARIRPQLCLAVAGACQDLVARPLRRAAGCAGR